MRTPSPARLAEARRMLEGSEAPAARNSEPAPPAAPAFSLSEAELRLSPGLHEWLADDADGLAVPPLGVLIDLVRRHAEGGRSVLWIGRRCWPHPHALALRGESDTLLHRSVFVDPPSRAELIWSADAALRRHAVTIADGAGLSMSESRRLQLAAKDAGALALVARPRRERTQISAARTRWLVTPFASESLEQTWMVQLLRCKGVQPEIEGARRWLAQRDHATGAITSWRACDERLAPDVDHRRPQQAPPPSRARIA